MTAPYSSDDREKVVAKLPTDIRRELKVRAAEWTTDIQDAVTEGVTSWIALDSHPAVDTSGGMSFATYLPTGLYEQLKVASKARKVSYNQGMAQAIRHWLDSHPSPRPGTPRTTGARRLVFGNQKGGVGKTAVSAGVAQALAETGQKVLLIDFDPQGHLTKQLGHERLEIDSVSLAKHMLDENKNRELKDLFVPIKGGDFEERLWLLPSCKDAFLLDAKLATTRAVRIKETALERVMEAVEQDFDFIVIDCPPSLGYAMDTALYYGRTREGEEPGQSGIVIPVQAEDTSGDAYDMLAEQMDDMCDDLDVTIETLGFVVNLYDARNGYIATSSLQSWQSMDEPVLGIVPELKEQREAVRRKEPLLAYEPECEQAQVLRAIARRIKG
ncbi:ParA family protein [Streptomyces sp. NPDC006552]|uniref:ParA family protein n=1 Tax=Streptomyces sp. NPDC006552 TaxID=3157179 RepID=UPI0033B40E88